MQPVNNAIKLFGIRISLNLNSEGEIQFYDRLNNRL